MYTLRVRLFFVLSLLAACGGAPKAAVPSQASAASPTAIAKMLEAMESLSPKENPARRAEAIRKLEEALRIDPHLWEARYNLAVLLVRGGDLPRAKEALSQVSRERPENEAACLLLADVEDRMGDKRSSYQTLTAFASKYPDSKDVRLALSRVARELGELDKAVSLLRALLVSRPSDAVTLSELALAHLAKGERDTALFVAKEALVANEKSSIAHRTLGIVELEQGKDALAFQSFVRAAREDPNDKVSRLYVAQVLFQAGAYAKAEEHYRAMAEMDPKDERALLGLAACKRLLSDKEHPERLLEAKALLERALVQSPDSEHVLYNLGMLLLLSFKKPDEAKPLLLRFLRVASKGHPGRSEAQKVVGGGS